MVPLRVARATCGVRRPNPAAGTSVVWDGGIDDLLAKLTDTGVTPIEGPVPRLGGRAGGATPGVSVYARDPDDNLIEFMSYEPDDVARSPGASAGRRLSRPTVWAPPDDRFVRRCGGSAGRGLGRPVGRIEAHQLPARSGGASVPGRS